MCLHTISNPETTKNYIAKMVEDKQGLVTLFKVVARRNNDYWPIYGKLITADTKVLRPFKEGLDEAVTTKEIETEIDGCYNSGFHFFIHEMEALQFRIRDEIVLKCKVKKEWIMTLGFQDYKSVVVTSKAIFPKYN